MVFFTTYLHTRMTAVELHSQCYISMEFYWVNTNKASHDRWVERVEKSAFLVHVTSEYLNKKDKRKVTFNLSFFTANKPGAIISVDKNRVFLGEMLARTSWRGFFLNYDSTETREIRVRFQIFCHLACR